MKKTLKILLVGFIVLIIGGTMGGLTVYTFFTPHNITYKTVEEIEVYSCTDDTYVDSDAPDENYGNETAWLSGNYLGTKWYYAYFKFNLSDKPNNIVKGIVSLQIIIGAFDLVLPIYLNNNSWTEEEITYNNRPLPSGMVIIPFYMGVNESKITYYIDITDYAEDPFISFMIYSDTTADCGGFTKEYQFLSDNPRIIWTYEIIHTI